MEIIVTLEEVQEKCENWTTFCEDEGWEPRCIEQGYGDLEITLTKQACFKYGILKMYE